MKSFRKKLFKSIVDLNGIKMYSDCANKLNTSWQYMIKVTIDETHLNRKDPIFESEMSRIFGIPESIINQIKLIRNDIVHPKKSIYNNFSDYDKINYSLINKITTLPMLLKLISK